MSYYEKRTRPDGSYFYSQVLKDGKQQSELAPATSSAKRWTDEECNWLLQQMDLMSKLKETDNRKLLWLGMNTKAWKSLDVGGVEAEIFGEIENRLYPEYNGETVTFEEWGWNTPEGEIRYLPNNELSDPKGSLR